MTKQRSKRILPSRVAATKAGDREAGEGGGGGKDIEDIENVPPFSSLDSYCKGNKYPKLALNETLNDQGEILPVPRDSLSYVFEGDHSLEEILQNIEKGKKAPHVRRMSIKCEKTILKSPHRGRFFKPKTSESEDELDTSPQGMCQKSSPAISEIEKTPVGKSRAGNSKVGKRPLGKTQVGKRPVGKTQVGKRPVGNSKVGKSLDGINPDVISPIKKTQVGKRPVGKTQVGKSRVGNSKVGKSLDGKNPDVISPIKKTQVGKRPVGKTQVGKSRVGNSKIGKSFDGKNPDLISPIKKTQVGKRPVGKTPGGKSRVGNSKIGKSPIEKRTYARKTIPKEKKMTYLKQCDLKRHAEEVIFKKTSVSCAQLPTTPKRKPRLSCSPAVPPPLQHRLSVPSTSSVGLNHESDDDFFSMLAQSKIASMNDSDVTTGNCSSSSISPNKFDVHNYSSSSGCEANNTVNLKYRSQIFKFMKSKAKLNHPSEESKRNNFKKFKTFKLDDNEFNAKSSDISCCDVSNDVSS